MNAINNGNSNILVCHVHPVITKGMYSTNKEMQNNSNVIIRNDDLLISVKLVLINNLDLKMLLKNCASTMIT